MISTLLFDLVMYGNLDTARLRETETFERFESSCCRYIWEVLRSVLGTLGKVVGMCLEKHVF